MNITSQAAVMEEVLNKERLAVLRELALTDDGEGTFEMVYDRITTLASKVVGAPVALMSMVAAEFQFFKSYIGLPEPWKSRRNTPLSHSFCKHVVAEQQPLIVSDAREVDFLKDNKAIPELDVIGYLGIPVTVKLENEERTLGSFCVIDSTPREWTETEIAIVQTLAQIITEEIELKAHTIFDAKYKQKLSELHAKINSMLDDLDTTQPKEQILAQLHQLRTAYAL